MKKLLILSATVFLVFGFLSLASATFIEHNASAVKTLDPVSAYAPWYSAGTGLTDQHQLAELQPYPVPGSLNTEAVQAFAGQSHNKGYLSGGIQSLFSSNPFLFASEAPMGAESGSPIAPSSVLWFLVAGLLGLVGVRRRRRG